MNVSPSISLVYTALWATGVLNVEISEKRALDLKQRKIIILMTHHSGVHLAHRRPRLKLRSRICCINNTILFGTMRRRCSGVGKEKKKTESFGSRRCELL